MHRKPRIALLTSIVAALMIAGCGGTMGRPDEASGQLPPPAVPASPVSAPSARPDPTPAPPDTVLDRGSTPPDVTLTSARFGVPISFRLDPFGGDAANSLGRGTSDFCDAWVTARAIVMPWLRSCVPDLRILLPDAVDCGPDDARMDSASVAARLLAHPTLGARDLGTLGATTVLPPGFVSGAAGGHVIDIPGTARPFDPTASDPDGCVLRGDPAIELRADMPQRLVLLDVGTDLVVFRVSGGGYDGESGSAARRRGFGSDEIDLLFEVIVERMHDLSFGAAAASAAPERAAP